MLVNGAPYALQTVPRAARPDLKMNLPMNLTKSMTRWAVAGAALALGGLAAGCQQGGGYAADQRDPIGPAPTNIASPGIGAPGGPTLAPPGAGRGARRAGAPPRGGPSTPMTPPITR